jgi:hypothetical protein
MNSNSHHPTIQARKLHFLPRPDPPSTFPISPPPQSQFLGYRRLPFILLLHRGLGFFNVDIPNTNLPRRRLVRSGQAWQNSRQGFYSVQTGSGAQPTPEPMAKDLSLAVYRMQHEISQFPAVLGERVHNVSLYLQSACTTAGLGLR